jgi:hypothetical protein
MPMSELLHSASRMPMMIIRALGCLGSPRGIGGSSREGREVRMPWEWPIDSG